MHYISTPIYSHLICNSTQWLLLFVETIYLPKYDKRYNKQYKYNKSEEYCVTVYIGSFANRTNTSSDSSTYAHNANISNVII